MNTETMEAIASPHDSQHATLPADPASGLVLLPLSRLRASTRNVRKNGGTAVAELASSIARVGLLQNLTVIAAPGGAHHDVIAGRRRLAALKLLVKRRTLAKDHHVHCLVVKDDAALTVSLTENVQREAMSPIDELLAWKDLVAEGRPVEDIAADFGVTPLVVQRRLKLASVSPRLLAAFATREVTLEQLMALASTDDHAAQETAFFDSPPWQRSAQALRDHLTAHEADASRDPLARFVGLPAYEQAGGGVRRDLFSDDKAGVFLLDNHLLESLAREKLTPAAVQVRAEGWSWVDVAPRAAACELHHFQRARSTRRAPNKIQVKRIQALEDQQAKLQERLDDENKPLTDEQAQQLQTQMNALGDELEAIESQLVEYPPDVLRVAGCVVTLDHLGGTVIHRGLLREEQAKAYREQILQAQGGASHAPDDPSDGPSATGLSEKLVRRLSAHRTAALQAEVARHPGVALVALVHRLALRVILDSYGANGSSLEISALPQDGLRSHAPEIDDLPAATGLRRVRRAWADRLPKDPQALFAELLTLPQRELLALLAVCVACTVNALASHDDKVPADELARAVNLDMHDWWTPSADGYFAHVSRDRALQAVQDFAPGEVNRLSKLKKAAIAAEAERLAFGTGWLPPMFRTLAGSAESGAHALDGALGAQTGDAGHASGEVDHAIVG